MHKKRRFSPAERFGVWDAYGGLCHWCGKPVDFREVTIDHVIPESTKADQLSEIIEKYSLPTSFDLNDFPNWVPAHGSCNRAKAANLYLASPAMISVLHTAARQATKAKAAARKIESNNAKAGILARVESAVDSGVITLNDLKILFSGMERLTYLKRGSETLMLEPEVGIIRNNNGVMAVSHGKELFFTAQAKSATWDEVPQILNEKIAASTERCVTCGRSMRQGA